MPSTIVGNLWRCYGSQKIPCIMVLKDVPKPCLRIRFFDVFLICCFFNFWFFPSVILSTYLWCCCIYCSIEYYVIDSVSSCRICTASKICKEYTPSGCCASNTKICPTSCAATSWASPLLTSPLLPSLPPPPRNPFLQI